MKTVIYYNVTTGESFDQEGSLRTQNNPFSASYGERRTFEWHLMENTDSDKAVSEWLPWTDWEIVPQNASTAADDNYLAAYPAVLKESAVPGTGVLSVRTDVSSEKISPSGTLRIFLPDDTRLMLAYSAVNPSSDGLIFAAEVPDTVEEIPAGTRLDIMEEPLIHASGFTAEKSTPEDGIFSFDLNMQGWRLTEKMEYSDIESLTAKGLELCVSGADPVSGESTVLLRCQVPFVIKNVISLYSL